MKIAVTGATGFIGRLVVHELLRREGVTVVAMSRRTPPEGLLPSSVAHVALDLSCPTDRDLDRLGTPDIVIHLAWSGLPNYKSLHHFESHLGEQYRFLSGMVRAGLPSLLCTGTCFEYGMRSGELDESLTPDPCNSYGYAKNALHCQLDLLRATHPFEFTWARLFYMYGDDQLATSLYAQLLAAGKRGDASFKMSRGEQLRDFLPAAVVATYLVDLALLGSGAGTVNVCSGQPVSVRSQVEKWMLQHGWDMTLELGYHPYPDYEPMAFWGSNTRLLQLLKRRG
jgi:nucleoside-diphosphate-sugar epimerase